MTVELGDYLRGRGAERAVELELRPDKPDRTPHLMRCLLGAMRRNGVSACEVTVESFASVAQVEARPGKELADICVMALVSHGAGLGH